MSADTVSLVLSVLAILISLASAWIGWLTARDLRRAEKSFDRTNRPGPTTLKDIM